MFKRLIAWVEMFFLTAFWWQTRFDLRDIWPSGFNSPLNSDYLIPFVYLSDIIFITLLVLWGLNCWNKVLDGEWWHREIEQVRHGLKNIYGVVMQPMWWLVGFAGLLLLGLWIYPSAWWNWYGWWRIVQGIALSWYVFQRFRDSNVRFRYGLVLMGGLILEAILLGAEWWRQASWGLQWIGEWRFTVFTPGIAKIVFNGQEYLRPHGTFAHPNIAGGILALAAVLMVWWYRYEQQLQGGNRYIPQKLQGLKVVYRPLLLAGIVVIGVGLVLSFSRSAWTAAALGLMVSGWMWYRQHHQVKNLFHHWRIGLLILVGFAVLFGPLIVARFAALDSSDTSSWDRRVQLMEVAEELLVKHPGTGVGLQNFVVQLGQYGPLYGVGIWREPVHNLYLLIMVETGMVAFSLWLGALLLLWMLLMKSYRRWQNYQVGVALVLWLEIGLLGFIDHYWWTSQQGRLVVWMMIGWSLALLFHSKAKRASQPSSEENQEELMLG